MSPITIILLLALGAVFAAHLYWRKRWSASQAELGQVRRELAAQRDEALQEQHRERVRRQTLFDSMMEGVLLLDMEHRLEFANLSCRRLLGLVDVIQGKTMLELVRHPDVNIIMDRLKRDHHVSGLELVLHSPVERHLTVNATMLWDEQGRAQGTMMVFHDITRVKELERNRKEFVANVSHELRTPISLIKGFVETLLDGAMEEPAHAKRFLQTIAKHTDRLTYLIEDLLTLSRLEGSQISLNLQKISAYEIAEQSMEDLRQRAQERSISMENGIPDGLVLYCDRERMLQVFSNLLENAIKYGRNGGNVRLGGRAQPSGETQIWVEDDGPGIPAESRERVFERFYRVDRARSRDTGGTGLGLAIVKHIIQAHGGEVWVKSELEKGSTFFFSLPTEPDSQG